jgi:hypothetical protein
MAAPPEVIPLADSRGDRQAKARQRRRAAEARLEVAKDVLALIARGKWEEEHAG